MAASPTFSHRLKNVFANPDDYQPDRYLREWARPCCVGIVHVGSVVAAAPCYPCGRACWRGPAQLPPLQAALPCWVPWAPLPTHLPGSLSSRHPLPPPTRPYAHTNTNTLPSSCLCAAPREEEKALPFSYIGFGGGRHGCMGQNFAYLQVRPLEPSGCCVCAHSGWLVEPCA